MPRQNRVTPFGAIIATPERGTFLGNRGVLHDAEGDIRKPWAVRRWIVCVLEFRGRKGSVMTLSHYTELFFLDEATALAAGHRPCAECRHARFLDFCNAWAKANHTDRRAGRPTATVIDDCLHAERIASDRSKRTFTAALDDLPDGVFVAVPARGEQAYLVWSDHLLAWSPGGYGERRESSSQADKPPWRYFRGRAPTSPRHGTRPSRSSPPGITQQFTYGGARLSRIRRPFWRLYKPAWGSTSSPCRGSGRSTLRDILEEVAGSDRRLPYRDR